MLGLKYKARHNWNDHAAPEPEIVEMTTRKMAVVHTSGDPDRVMHLVLPALYSAVYKLNCSLRRAGKGFPLEHLRVRWPDAANLPLHLRHGIWGLPIPDETNLLPQRFPYIAVEIETWQYGTTAQLLHVGSPYEDGADLERLRAFVTGCGYEIAGDYEEELLSGLSGSGGPSAVPQKIMLRFPVRKPAKLTLSSALGPVREHRLPVVSKR
jgi:hypothetical protein